MKINRSDLMEVINKIYLVISSSEYLEDQSLYIQDNHDKEHLYIGIKKSFMTLAFKIRVEHKSDDNIDLIVNFLTFAAIVQHGEEVLIVSKHGKNILKINDCLLNFLPPKNLKSLISFFPGSKSFTISPEELVKGIKKTSYATSIDPTRFVLGGIAIHPNHISATDGHRLAAFNRKTTDIDPKSKDINSIAIVQWEKIITLIANTESEIKVDRNFQTTILMGDNWIYYEEMTTYPNIDALMSTKFKTKFVLSKSNLMSALERCGSTIEHTTNNDIPYRSIDLEISRNYFSISKGENTEIIKQKQITQKEVTIALNPCYLWDGLKNLDGDNLTILFNSEDSPIILKTDDKAIALLMPVKRRR